MKLTQKLRNFWRLEKNSASGFTLVELIVVIAVLAILAGIAVPAYSGYVEKTNKTADQTMVSEIVNAATLAHYASPLTGSASVVVTEDGAQVTGSDEVASAWMTDALVKVFGSGWADTLSLRYDGWGNGVAVAQVMVNALTTGDVASAMENIYGDANNLSFTEEIPTLMEEIRSVAEAVADSHFESYGDADVINLVNGAAGITSGWNVNAIQALWNNQISYDAETKTYSGYSDSLIPAGTEAFDEKLTIAGVIRAKNTCLALYAAENGFDEYYDILASYSVSENSMMPMDLTAAAATDEGAAKIAAACGLSLSDPEDAAKAQQLAGLIGNYYSDGGSGTETYKNDAAAYYTMMNVVNTMAEEETLSGDNLDEYFSSVEGPVTMFQSLVDGSLNINDLNTSLSSVTVSGTNNITLTFANKGGELEAVPTLEYFLSK